MRHHEQRFGSDPRQRRQPIATYPPASKKTAAQRRRCWSRLATVEALECRTLLTSGLTPPPGSAAIYQGNLDVEGLANSAIVIDATDPANATVTINGVQVFSGAIPDGGGVVVNEPEGGTDTIQITTSVNAVLNGGSGSNTFNVTLSGTGNETVTVSGNGTDTLTVQGPSVSNAALALTASALVLQNSQAAGSETVDYSGLGSLSVNTSGAQTYSGAVVLGTDTNLFGSDVTFAMTVDGAYDLTVDTTGAATFDGLVGSSTALESVTALGGGSTVFDGGGVTTSAGQSYGEITLGANTALATTAGGSNPAGSGLTLGVLTGAGFDLSLNAGTTGVILANAVAGVSSLTIVNSGSATFAGALSAATADLIDSAGTIAFQDDLILTTGLVTAAKPFSVAITGASNTIAGATSFLNTGSVALGQATGTTQFTGGLDTSAVIGGAILAGTISTTDAGLVLGTVTLADDVVVAAGTATVSFNATVNGANDLTVNSATVISAVVGGTTPLASLTLNAIATLSGGTITTSGGQTFNAALTLATDVTLVSASAGDIDLGTIDGAFALTVDTAGVSRFGASVGAVNPLASLTTDAPGSTTINGGTIKTTGAQTYNDAVSLGADTTLTSTNAGNVTFGSTVDGTFALTINSAGTTVFGAAVGNTNPLASLTTDSAGSTALNGGVINTTGAQTYNDPILLGAATTLVGSAAGDISLGSSVDGAFALVLNTAGTTTLHAAIGAVTPITSLVADAPGTTVLDGGSINTAGAQTFNDAVTLGADTTLTSNAAGAISFASTINGPFALAVNTAGTTTFGAPVGNTTSLASLITNAAGVTSLSGGAVKTAGAQTYNDPVTLAASTTLTSTAAGDITFASTVDGPVALNVNTAGNTTFDADVGTLAPLVSITTDAQGHTTLNLSAAHTTGTQTYNDPVTLAADTMLSSSGAADITLAGTVDGSFALTVNTGGITRFGGAVGGATTLSSLATDAPGSVALNGGLVKTSGAQAYNDPIALGADTTLTSTAAGSVSLGGTVDGAFGLTVNTAGTTTLGAALGGTTPLASLTTDAAGSTAIKTTSIQTTGQQTYNDAIILNVGTTLSSSASGNISFVGMVDGAFSLAVNTAGTTSFGGTVGGTTPLASVTTNAPGTTTLNGGSVKTSGAQTYNDAITLGADTTLSSTASGDVTLENTVDGAFALTVNTAGTTTLGAAFGNAVPLASLTIDAPGNTALSGGSVKTSGAQTYNDAITLGAATTLTSTSAGDVTLASSVDGAFALAINTAGTTSLGGALGGVTPLASVTTDAPGTTTINGGSVKTSGAQTYNDALALGADTTLSSTSAGAITLASTVNGAFGLIVNTAGTTTIAAALGAVVPLASLSTDAPGTTALNGGTVKTAGAQTYGDALSLGAAATLTSTGSGDISLASTVDGAFALAVNTAGTTSLGGTVGTATALASLTTDAFGATTIGGGSIMTLGAQTYNDAVSLGANTTLASTGAADITLANTVDGSFSLTVNTEGTTRFGGAVGAFTALSSVATDAPGATSISGGTIKTTGAQTYNDAITSGSDTVLTSTGAGDINFSSSVNGAFALSVQTAGTSHFGAAVGDLVSLASLTTDASGSTVLDGGVVNTTGAQHFNDPISLGAATTLTSSAAGDIALAGTVDGPFALTVHTAGTTNLGAAVGGTTPLASITTDAPGSTALNGGTVKTTGAQTYNDAVTLGAATTLTSTGSGGVTLGNTVDGAFALTINTAGTTTLNGALGGAMPLASFTTDAPGATAINGGLVKTSGAQAYNDSVALGANTTLVSTAAGNVSLNGTIDGAFGLTINTAGTTTLGAAVGSAGPLASLTTDAPGSLALNGGTVKTLGAQTYNDPVALGANTTLNSTASGAINLAATVDGAFDLTINTAAITRLGSAVGGQTPLAALTTDAAGSTLLSGGAITASGVQTFNDPVALAADTTLTSTSAGDIKFNAAVDGAFALTVNTTGTTKLGAAVGGATPLASLTTDAAGSTVLNGGPVRTTGPQTYSDPIILGADTTLISISAGDINLANRVDGAFALMVNTGGTTHLGGVVGGVSPLTKLSTDAAGATVVDGGSVVTSDSQTYKDSVTLGSAATLTSTGAGDISLDGTVDGAFALVVNTAGVTAFSAAVGAAIPLASLTMDAPGTTVLSGGSIRTTGAQTYSDAIRLGAATTLTSTSAGNITLANTTDGLFALAVNTAGGTFLGPVGATTPLASLTTDASGVTVLIGGGVTTTGSQTFSDAVTLEADTTLSTTAAGGVNLNGTVDGAFALSVNTAGVTLIGAVVGGATPLTSLITDAPGATALDGGSVTTSGDQVFHDAVTLDAATTLASTGTGDVTFGATVDGAFALAVNTAGTTLFGGALGAVAPLASLATDAAGSTALNGGTVNTTGGQTYNDPISLGAAAILSSTTAGDISFGSTVDGAFALTVNTAGTTFVGAAVGSTIPLASVLTDAPGTTALDGGLIVTSSPQTYNDAVILGADTTLISTSAGAISFNGTVNGAFTLTVNTAGTTVFGAAVGGTNPLASLTTDAAGSTALNGGAINTTGAQTYNDPILLGAAAALASSAAGDINLGSSVDGAFALVLNTAGTTTLHAVVGAVTPLASLLTDAPGTTVLDGGSIDTTGAQTFDDAIALGAAATITSNAAGDITFVNTVDGPFALVVNSAGTTAFGAPVGNTTSLASLTTDGAGGTALNGGTVNTSGAQTYNDPVSLGAGTTLTSSAAGDITFTSTIDGAFAFTANTAGNTIFDAAVGTLSPLASISTDAQGHTTLNLGTAYSTGTQTYNDPVTLAADTTLSSSGAADITFAGTVDGAFALTVETAGITRFGGAVGAATSLSSLTTDAPGSAALNGGLVKTSGAQTYNDPIALGADMTLASTSAGEINLANTVDGAFALVVSTAGSTILGAAVGADTPLASLATDSPGTTAINGGTVNTSGAQTYNDSVILGANTTLTSNAAGNITFSSSIDGAFALNVNTAGNATFNAAVGALSPLASLNTDAQGHTTLNLGAAYTTGSQTYNDPVTLAANTTLSSSGAADITFAGAVDGSFALTVNTAGITRLGGAVGATTPLASLNTDAPGSTAINGGAVKTSGAQIYNDPVTLGAASTLTSNGAQAITFASTVDGPFALTLNTAGVTKFASPVGGAVPLASLTTDTPGSTAINGGTVKTSGPQTYNDAVTLGANTTLTSTGAGSAGNIGFVSTVNDGNAAGTDSLTVATSGTTTFFAAVGGNSALSSVTTQGFPLATSGATLISGGAVTTTGAQSYNATTLLSATTLRSTVGANITFRATATWNGSLTVTTSGGNASFTGAASGGAGADLTVDAGAGSITFGSTVDGVFSLYANSAGITTFAAAVGGTTPLVRVVTDQAGRTNIGASMKTTGDLTFNDAVYLLADVTLTDAGPTATGILFNSTVDSNGPTNPQFAYALTVVSNHPKIFNGAVGSMFPLSKLITTVYDPAQPSSPTQINGGLVMTTGDQNYIENIVLGGSTKLDAGGAASVMGTVTAAPGANVTLTVVGGADTSTVGFENCQVDLVVDLQTGTSPTVKLGQAQNVVNTPVGTNATIFGGGSTSQNTFQITTSNGSSGGAPNGGTSFSGGSGTAPSGDATNLTLVNGGGYNTINLTGAPLGVALDLRNTNGQPQSLYNQALTNPNTEEQGQIAGFSGTFFTTLQNSTLSLIGSFQAVVAGSNNLLFAAPSTSTPGGDSPEPGSLIMLTGENNVVQGAQGSTILAFSSNNQVVQNTTAGDQSQINGFLASNQSAVQAFLTNSNAGQQAFIAQNAAGLSQYLLKSPTGSQAFLQQSNAALSAFITSNPSAQQAYLQQNATSLAAYLVSNPTTLAQYLSTNAAGFAAYLASNPSAQQAYLVQNGAAIAQFLVGSPASQQAYVLSNTAGLAAFVVSNPAAVSAFLAGNPAYTGGAAGLQSFLVANPSALQQFVTSSSTGIAAYLTSNPSNLQAFLIQNGTNLAQFLVGSPAGQQAYLQNNATGIAQYIVNNPSAQQAFLQQNPSGLSAYLVSNAGALSAYLGTDPAGLQAYQEGGNSGLSAYLQSNPTGLQQYIASNPTALSQYLVSNPSALSQYLTNNPAILPNYLGSNPSALSQYLSSNPALLSQYLANTSVLSQYIASSSTSVQQFLQSSPTALAQFITSNPTLLQQFLTSALGGNATVLQQYLVTNSAALSQYLANNPGALQQFLAGDPQALVQFLQQPGNSGILSQFLNQSTLDLFRLKVTLAGSGNEVTGGLLATFSMGSGSFIEQIDPVQFQNLIVPGVASGIAPSAFGLNVTMGAGANVVVGGLLGNFTSPGGNTKFVIEDPSLLGIPTGTFDDAISADAMHASALSKIIQSPGSGGIFNGGGAGDTFYFVGGAHNSRPNGSPFGHVVLTEPTGVIGGTLDFSNFRGGITLNLAQATDQQVNLNTLWLTLPPNLTHVIGTASSDTITANSQNDLIEGAALPSNHPNDLPGPVLSFRTQWVYLNFDTPSANMSSYETLSQWNPGGVYSAADRLAVLQELQQIYAPFGNLVRFTLTPPTAAQAPQGYTTVYFDQTPLVDGAPQPGGHSSEIDWRNLNLADTVQVDVNGFLDTLTDPVPQPQIINPGSQLLPDTHTNFLSLSITIAAHEVGHTLGLEHQDAFGPIGFGITDPPGATSFNPAYFGFIGAFQSALNVMASPASVGSTLADAASDLINLGERSAILLAFILGGDVFNGGTGSPAHNTYATAQPVSPTGGLYSLNVPDPITTGFDADKSFDVAAVDITGHIGGTQTFSVPDPKHPGQTLTLTKAVPDYYTFYGQAGDLMNFQVMSAALGRLSHPIDSVLHVYDPNGNLIATNDDNFESSDSSIVDLLLSLTGKYTVEISSYSANQDPAFSFFLDPNNANYNPAAFYGAGTGDYELLIYRFNAYNTTSGNDTLIAGSGNDTLVGGTGNDTIILGTGTAAINGGGGVNTLRASGDGNFSLSGNGITGATGGTGTFTNIQQVALTDTGVTGGHTFAIQPSWTGPVTISGPSGLDTLLAPGSLNAQVTATSSLVKVTVAQDLAGTVNIGSSTTPADVGSASVGGSVTGALNVTGNLGAMNVGQNVAGTIAVNGSIGALNSPTSLLSVGGAVTKTGLIAAGNLFGLTIGPDAAVSGDDMAGQIVVSSAGLLGDLRIAGGAPGTITAGRIGTIRVYAGYGPFVLQVNEAGVQRYVEATAPSAPFPIALPPSAGALPNPLPSVTFQLVYEGLGTALVESLAPNLNPTDPQLTARINHPAGSTAPDQFDLSLVAYHDKGAFNLARLDAGTGNGGITGLRNVAVEGSLLTKVTQAASNFINHTVSNVPLAAGISLPKDALAGVGLRDNAPLGLISAKSIEAVAFGAFSNSNGNVTNATSASSGNAAALLSPGTAIVAAGVGSAGRLETFRVPFADLNPVAFFYASSNNSFNGNRILFSIQDTGIYPGPTASNLARGSDVALVSALQPNAGSASIIQSIAVLGDNAAIQTALSVTQSVSSTGPLGDVNLGGPLQANITAASLFGSIVVNGALTGTIQTTGITTDPITGATSLIPGDLGRVYLPSGKGSTPVATAITANGAISGNIISAGNLISQITANGGISGNIEAQGDLGARVGTSLLGGVTSNGAFTGSIVALGNIIGNTTVNGAVTTVTSNPLSGVIAASGPLGLVGNLTVNGGFGGQLLTIGPLSGLVTLNGGMQKGRIAAQGGIPGGLTINGGLDAQSAIVSGGAIGTSKTVIKVNGNNLGIIAAKGTIISGGNPLTGNVFTSSSPSATVNAAAIDHIFASASAPLSALDLFDTTSPLDLVRLKQLLRNLNVLTVKGGVLDDSGTVSPQVPPPPDPPRGGSVPPKTIPSTPR